MKRNLATVKIAVVDMTTVHFAWTYPNPLLLLNSWEIWITITLSYQLYRELFISTLILYW